MASITIRDIAERLGVSETAVSFAINNQPGISDETRAKILKEVERTNYKPRKSKTSKGKIALVLSMRLSAERENPIFSEILDSIYMEAEKSGYQVDHIYFTKGSELSKVDLGKQDGILILGTNLRADNVLPLTKMGKPLVVMDNSFKNLPVNTVSLDNHGGIASAVNHLSKKGHTKIGYVKSVSNIQNFIERYTEFVRVAAELDLDIIDTISVGMSPAGAYTEMCQWLENNKPKVTALVTDNDYIALGVMRALKEHGIVVGQDISIIGFDDLQYSHISDPPLTTVRIFGERIGSTSFKRLLEVIGDPEQPHSHISIGTKLIIRDSVHKISSEET